MVGPEQRHRVWRAGQAWVHVAYRSVFFFVAFLLLSVPVLVRADDDEDEPPIEVTSTPSAGPTLPAGTVRPSPTAASGTPGSRPTDDPAASTSTPTATTLNPPAEATSAVPRSASPGGKAYPVPTDQPADYALEGGHFFSQSVPGAPPGFGFAVTDAAGLSFWTEYLSHGGFDRLGYPISRRFHEPDAWSQAFQGGLLRWTLGADAPDLVSLSEPNRLPPPAIEPEPPARLGGAAARKPWSGWWWPATPLVRGPHLFDSDGPLAKYDLYVARNGKDDPETMEWEQSELRLDRFAWAGHCNGWAAASLLEPEPTVEREIGPLTFTVGDQKGLLSAYHFADAAAWLHGDDEADVTPVDLHRRLVDWLGSRHRGFILTFRPFDDDEVWSYPVYRFELLMSPDLEQPGATNVSATVWLADNEVESSFVGLRPWKGQPQTYEYRLFGPPDAPTGGEWRGASADGGFHRPGLIWYPDPDHRNLDRTLASPGLEYRTIKRILRGRS